jgi:MoxR-like ATPase
LPLVLPKYLLEALCTAIVHAEFTHVSGPTGTAKTSLIESLYRVPENFHHVCASLGFRPLPLRVYTVEMAIYEAPGELWQRRAVKDGSTYDEPSALVRALEDASRQPESYRVIWLREIGRVHSASVQGGLLDLMSKSHVLLPDGTALDVRGVGWIADSNYQAAQDCTHTLVTFDDALARRFTVNLTLDYLPPEQEAAILREVYPEIMQVSADEDSAAEERIAKLVQLGHVTRRHKAEGNLQSIPPTTLDSYVTALRMARTLPHWSLEDIARVCLFGNPSSEDRKHVNAVMSEVLGLTIGEDEEFPAELF